MQAFFILTGYTSNFNKPLREFFVNTFKTIVIPYISFSIITKIIGVIFFNQSFLSTNGEESWLFIIENFWFIHALLLAKVVYWLLNRCSTIKQFIGIVSFAIAIIGFTITLYYKNQGHSMPSHYHNYLHYRNAMCMMFFLWVGHSCREIFDKNKLLLVGSICFIVGCSISFIMNHFGFSTKLYGPVPYTHTTDIQSLAQIPAYLLYSVSGTCFIVLLSKSVSLRFLTYIGKNSLTYYCMHFILMTIVISVIHKWLDPISYTAAIAYFVCVFVLTVILCSMTSQILNKKPINVLLGKF